MEPFTSIYSFARKVGQALAGGVGGFAIAAVGYSSTVKVQSDAALSGIHTLATLLPAVIYLVVFLILVFIYPLNKARLSKLTVDLAEKRKENEAANTTVE